MAYNYMLDRAITETKGTLETIQAISEACREKSMAITKLDEAIMWLERMKHNQEDDEDELV